MRSTASIMHLDLDAFFASVEQRDKPSLRGRPVIVGGTGMRGVVATASYEARRYGVGSAMSTREARGRCPHAAYLAGRFDAYRAASRTVMELLHEVSPRVEPLSLDEAFVDLAAADHPDLPDLTDATLRAFAQTLRDRVHEATGGLTASVGLGTSKFIAKVASDLDKPDGLVLISPGTEQEVLRPMSVRVLPGVGPATEQRLHRIGVHTVEELERLELAELVRDIGRSHGTALYALARAQDDREVVTERETKSVSQESTFETDLTDRSVMEGLLTRQAGDVARRLGAHGLSGRTVSIKVRLHDFTTLSRSSTLASPTDQAPTIARTARSLLGGLDTSGGVRLLGVGVSGLADWIQEDLFSSVEDEPPADRTPDETAGADEPSDPTEEAPAPDSSIPLVPPVPPGPPGPGSDTGHDSGPPQWRPGADVEHREHGRGWVWGSGRGVVTVRFETAETPPGPVRSFRVDDPDLSLWVWPTE